MKLSVLLFTLIFCALSYAQTPIPAGPVNGTWTFSGSPYLIMGEIGIPSGEMLTIEPGVTVEFQGHYKFSVQGQLLAVGNENDTILFTINDSTGFHDITIPDGGWNGIRFGYSNPGDDTSRISYCLFAFGKANGSATPDKQGGAIAVDDYPNLVISHNTFYNNAAFDNGGAIAVMNADVTLESNMFYHNNARNGGAVATYKSDLNMRKCILIDNRALNSGGAISLFSSSDGEFTSNLMAGNFADYGGAMQLELNCSPLIRNNLIYSNAANEEGGGVDLEDNCQATFNNNTITGNFALLGGGIDVEVNTSPTFRNDIIWENTAFVDGNQIHLFSEDSDPNFYYCDIQGGKDSIGTWYGDDIYLSYNGIYENNSDLDPDFITEGNYQFLLNDESPCIDAGDPDEQYNDLEDPGNLGYALWPSKGTVRNDMGAYGGPHAFFYDVTTGIEHPTNPVSTNQSCILYQNFPNPVSDQTRINYKLFETGHTVVSIMDMQGRGVLRLVDQKQSKGLHHVEFDAEKFNLNDGVYFYRLQIGNSIITRKLIVRKF